MKHLIFVSEAVAEEPLDGECLVDHWWVVGGDGLAFYFDHTARPGTHNPPRPQANRTEHVARTLQLKLYPELDVRRVPVVYLARVTAVAQAAYERRLVELQERHQRDTLARSFEQDTGSG